MRGTLIEIYEKLRDFFGFLNWWPGDTPFEVAVGAILTQSTAWKNVERAIDNLKKAKLLSERALYNAKTEDIGRLIKPALYFNQKAKKLKIFVEYLCANYGCNIENLKGVNLPGLRDELLGLWGIGPETADSIILYALEKPVFVIDAYTRRFLARHGYENALTAKYDELRLFFESNLPRDVELYKDYHAQFVELGKNYCKTKPLCDECPLRDLGKAFSKSDFKIK